MSPSSPAGSSSSSLCYTNTLLALPDGPIPSSHRDLISHTTSFIGGYPTFPALPSSSCSTKKVGNTPSEINCGICHKPIPLLAQVYCPPEDGENDRTIYVFACPRVGCQKREGSIRAWRASVRNEEYVRDVEEKRKAAEKAAQEERERARKNPFTVDEAARLNGSALFGTASPLFGGAAHNPFAPPNPVPAMATLSVSDDRPAPTPITSGPSRTFTPPIPAYHPVQYLSTIEEYIPPVDDDVSVASSDDDESPEQKAEWREEGWEKVLPRNVDEVFENFVRRLDQADGGKKQVLRYELGGMPLPYSSASPLTRKLFPGCEKPLAKDEELDLSALYTPKFIPTCPRCGGKRVFELQLVPSLINILRPHTISTTGEAPKASFPKAATEEERKKELAKLAAGVKEEASKDEEGEMEWGNVLVYGCERDCVGVGEEWVGVEWEATLEL
ncbi:pre-rRNA-processing protein TSR4 [Cryptococcus neoformans C23]|uniref:Pre-rRNA-processing protein TSR4 n=1 Tax=Cryptococcus neoformans (strain H99 / ATCC 208821 / CBS 10515 / FGSC 9487) TaxID=235443 RepID=J9VWE8_CRYN9|nr:pre-rRNA-processing protein TSR4 [Cryptococcus neoformans var. grubii H99]AFR98578.1 pre-rRNA-processing protein TSR4 [Cryptococcus neoformans var. grubii H99]AUB28747.1 pre-rRNA-processing protein TSR4 [Cryptococcus neoformans var. grubii]OWZ26905.1 pre-rRNA-processing protein TSR4 [Cryptococcus neoformans var. grubii AD2-60a]OWZ38766.1 pre-rRNA-processing protein TSR4 [Cryptococcus neoformans var. grubii C23]|eukprot:XP_012053423.1 pre-rRNA-processing protein TSR4 [Cryptococcus neoformans var. grubii H99]